MLSSRNNVVRALTVTATAALVIAGLGACSSDADGGGGDASSFPEGDINFIVQAAAGGGSDLTSRALSAELEGILGTSIVVENRPGASGSTAMQYVADQEADGYTIGFAPVEVSMLEHLGFDVLPENYDFLGQVMFSPGVIAVPADSPYDSLDDLVEASQDEAITVANAGAGSIWEAATLGLAEESGADLTPVPFDGGAPAVAAALGGQVDAVVAGAGETVQANADGTLKILALFNDEVHPMLEDVPTAESEGYDLMFGGWGGIYAPTGLPDDVKQALSDAIAEAAESDSFSDAITPSGALPTYKTPEEFTSFVESESERFAGLLGGN
ncbi:tripartite tricarboxylate transporter substrate binding protein [Labedella endophytica]|uniref:Tripartite tricarboxylate transporter substrate binding protein n=1 Tax=Labedella endophytica TaxID=1523160 RepID=A0A433JV05_9MICO|nr:tripartite tricarboxylate transporter substrate binding protein [Labedella endophytica]RUR01943.1 tripartite tricarboxylate transporter substrate binding protein [Labedella endophytica]